MEQNTEDGGRKFLRNANKLLSDFYVFADRASWYDLSQSPTWCTNSLFLIILQSSICFEQYYSHNLEVTHINTASGVVTVCKWLACAQVKRGLCTGQSLTDSDHTRCCVYTIDLLRMSIILIETCRGL
jgi:hypothetical protein